jgi:hypothetical protein
MGLVSALVAALNERKLSRSIIEVLAPEEAICNDGPATDERAVAGLSNLAAVCRS